MIPIIIFIRDVVDILVQLVVIVVIAYAVISWLVVFNVINMRKPVRLQRLAIPGDVRETDPQADPARAANDGRHGLLPDRRPDLPAPDQSGPSSSLLRMVDPASRRASRRLADLLDPPGRATR